MTPAERKRIDRRIRTLQDGLSALHWFERKILRELLQLERKLR